MLTPQEVPVFKQFVRVSPLNVLKDVADPAINRFTSSHVRVERLNPAGKVMAKLLEAVSPPWLTRLSCVVNAIVWFDVADTLELFNVSDRLVTCAPWEVSTREDQKNPIPKRRVRPRNFIEWLRTASAIRPEVNGEPPKGRELKRKTGQTPLTIVPYISIPRIRQPETA
jgi:hypothetical protein